MESNNNFFELSERYKQNIDWLNQILKGSDTDTVQVDGVLKPTISKHISDHYNEIKIMVSGRLSFKTLAELTASGAPPADKLLAEVWKDDVKDNNGLYGWGGDSWEKSPFDNVDALKRDLEATTQALTSGYRESIEKLEKTGVIGGDEHSIDVLLKSDLSADDEIVGAITDELGHMLEGWNSKGEKVIPVVVRLLKDLLLPNTQLEDGTYNYANAVTDESGNVSFGVETDTGKTLAALLKVFGPIELGKDSELLSGEYNYDFAIVDESGNVGFGFMSGRMLSPETNQIHQTAIRDNKNLTKSNQLKTWINPLPAQNVYDYNHLVVYGQSLSTGYEGWPRLSKLPLYGNLMLGESVRPKSISGTAFDPVGDSIKLSPLVAVVQDSSSGAVLDDDTVANLAPGNPASGETPTEGWTNMSKWLHNRFRLLNNDSERLFIGSNNGVPGRTIEQLSKGATPNLYNRFTQCLSHVKSIADAEMKSYGVTGICWMQGEYNYQGSNGGDMSYQGYLEKLKKLHQDMLTDVYAITGQVDEPAFLTYQSGAVYTNDAYELSIGMAQWNFTKEVPNSYLVGPIYPYTDKGGHLDSNGYRWFGNQIAKVYHRVVTLGQNWKPLCPIKSEIVGRTITIDFHVPEPPLQFGVPYVVQNPTDYSSKGFKVTDALGSVPIVSVDIVGQTIIEITLSREPDETAKLWYADKTQHLGNGNVMDSDQTIAHDKYVYDPNSGQYPDANKPELVDKPYPLNNWLIAFCIPVNWSE